MSVETTTAATFAIRDVAEIAMGACIMAFPVATAEEIWNLGEELTLVRAFLFSLASLFFLGLLVLLLHHGSDVPKDPKVFFQRVLSTYGLTLVIAALLLFGVDRLDLLGHPWVSLKRTILVAFPACFAATAVDSIAS